MKLEMSRREEKFFSRNDTMAQKKLKIEMITMQGLKAAYVSQEALCTFCPLHCTVQHHLSPEAVSLYPSPCPQDESPIDCHCEISVSHTSIQKWWPLHFQFSFT